MAKRITLTDDDRSLFSEIIGALGFTQKQLAAEIDVTDAWLSHLLQGTRKSPDSELVSLLATHLVGELKQNTPQPFLGEHLRNTLAALSRFAPVEQALVALPGEIVPLNAVHYIERVDDKKSSFLGLHGPYDDSLLRHLQGAGFTVIVRGGPQCGKSSMLARLESKANEIGLESCWFDPRLTAVASQELELPKDFTPPAVQSLYEQLRADWTLPESKSKIITIADFINWLQRAVASKPPAPRLLILDDLSCLGPDEADIWLNYIIRAINNSRNRGKLPINLAVGMTYRYGPRFHSRTENISSIVGWTARLELPWFSESQTRELCQLLDKENVCERIYALLRGQPYLTHAAVSDTEFLKALEKYEAGAKDAEAQLTESVWFDRHYRSIRESIQWPDLDAKHLKDDQKRVIEVFYNICTKGEVDANNDTVYFLKSSCLIKKVEVSEITDSSDSQESLHNAYSPTISCYRLIAKQLYALLKSTI